MYTVKQCQSNILAPEYIYLILRMLQLALQSAQQWKTPSLPSQCVSIPLSAHLC